MPRRAAIYARISLDRREGEGVARQLADCRELVAKRGWTAAGEYVDNDVSAFRRKRRPEWDRLVADLERGLVDALVVYHPDRTYRRLADLEELIDVVERQGAEIATVKAGDIDLATATGRMQARITAAVNRHESERIGERVSRAKRERAAQGRPPGGGFRPFGYTEDKLGLVRAEANAIRAAAKRVAAGGSIGAEVRRLNAQGFVTSAGRPWTVAALRRVLVSPRIAGLRAYKGEVVGKATWPAIIDEDTHRVLVVMTAGRRRGRVSSDRSLLSALIACPRCGHGLYRSTSNGGAYACAPGTRGGCGGSSISIAHADAAVVEAVEVWLSDPRVPGWIQDRGAPDLSAEVTALEQRRIGLARRWAAGEIGDDEYDAARKVLSERLTSLELPAPAAPPADVQLLVDAWRNGDTAKRRAVIEAVVDLPIQLAPGHHRDPRDRITVNFL